MILLLSTVIPFTPDLSDWGGRAFPQAYLSPLIILMLVGYVSGWVSGGFSPQTGRLCGILASILAGAAIVGLGYGGSLVKPLFHHPAYPIFSDHALLSLAVLLVSGHLGGLRVERGYLGRTAARMPDLKPASPDLP